MADIPDRSRLYAKTSHPHLCHPGIRGNLPASRNGAATLGADPQIQLHRPLRQKTIGRRCGPVLSEEDRPTDCQGRCADRSEIAPGRHHRPGARARAFTQKMLVFCERGAGCCRRSEIAAANAPCETSRPGAGEQLRIQKTAGLKSVRSACGICVGLRCQARTWSRGDSDRDWIRERFSLEDAIPPTTDWRFRQILSPEGGWIAPEAKPPSMQLQRAGLIRISGLAFGSILRRDYVDRHKSAMRLWPSQGFVSRFEESINYQRV